MAWNYVFNVKVEAVLKQWRHEIKHETYDRYEKDWHRFLNLDDRVDEIYFTALLMYWDSDAAKEGFEAASKEAASVYILQEEEQTEPDPYMLSAEENITLTQNLMGHNRRGRYPLHSVGSSPRISVRSSTTSSTPSTSMRAAPSSFQAMPFIARISAYLIDKIDPELHIQVTNEMTRVTLTANSMDDIMGYVIQNLGGTIPYSTYGGIIRIISSIDNNSDAR
ncbi:uncharacterized protein LOC109824741 [Asparagus officinalis]|uniref:uncharacterized protein LOC109824741 n=1 Tax=Asparagus officinalis TaxID=4686 RepID=UPI00098E45FB|nr:uncharacterized protein LOC109824741 [Asparagus officinalis]